jgi:hypothetical protein
VQPLMTSPAFEKGSALRLTTPLVPEGWTATQQRQYICSVLMSGSIHHRVSRFGPKCHGMALPQPQSRACNGLVTECPGTRQGELQKANSSSKCNHHTRKCTLPYLLLGGPLQCSAGTGSWCMQRQVDRQACHAFARLPYQDT